MDVGPIFKEQPKELLKNICEPEFKKTDNQINTNWTNANAKQSVESYRKGEVRH